MIRRCLDSSDAQLFASQEAGCKVGSLRTDFFNTQDMFYYRSEVARTRTEMLARDMSYSDLNALSRECVCQV